MSHSFVYRLMKYIPDLYPLFRATKKRIVEFHNPHLLLIQLLGKRLPVSYLFPDVHSELCRLRERTECHPADTYIQAWMNVCASLTNENIATLSNLTIMHLGSETLGTGITAVLSAGNPLLMGE